MNAAPPEPTALFRPGDRWLAVGDSITQNAGYAAWLYLYSATRFPNLPLELLNAGIAGDWAGGALKRYAWDIAPQNASVATVMFGMNDVNHALYGNDASSPGDVTARRHAALEDYAKNITELAAKLRHDGLRVTLLTPSPFDESGESARPRLPGINRALAECGAILRRIATEQGHGFIDLHGPMTAINLRLQAADPALSVVGPDRIHPGVPGHFLMAWLILKSQGAPSLVSAIDLDAAEGKIRAAQNVAISNLATSPGAVEFTATQNALPYPIFDDARPALAWFPFHEDLNQETLRVTGLPPGNYALAIDGEEVRRYTAEALATGVNLALEPGTPQMKQAFRVGDLVRRWQQVLTQRVRVLALVEYWHLADLPRPIDFNLARPRLEEKLAKAKDGTMPLDAYTHGIIETYLKSKPDEQNARAELNELAARIRTESKPRKHAYRIASAAPAPDGE